MQIDSLWPSDAIWGHRSGSKFGSGNGLLLEHKNIVFMTKKHPYVIHRNFVEMCCKLINNKSAWILCEWLGTDIGASHYLGPFY